MLNKNWSIFAVIPRQLLVKRDGQMGSSTPNPFISNSSSPLRIVPNAPACVVHFQVGPPNMRAMPSSHPPGVVLPVERILHELPIK
jgi:hypothetical protein